MIETIIHSAAKNDLFVFYRKMTIFVGSRITYAQKLLENLRLRFFSLLTSPKSLLLLNAMESLANQTIEAATISEH